MALRLLLVVDERAVRIWTRGARWWARRVRRRREGRCGGLERADLRGEVARERRRVQRAWAQEWVARCDLEWGSGAGRDDLVDVGEGEDVIVVRGRVRGGWVQRADVWAAGSVSLIASVIDPTRVESAQGSEWTTTLGEGRNARDQLPTSGSGDNT